MRYRKKVSRRRSKRQFTRNAVRVNRKNNNARVVMRGGIRL